MAMRRLSRQKRTIEISLADFGWDAATCAVLAHDSLPWNGRELAPKLDIEGVPLSDLSGLGGRDSLSLFGQFAAHEAFLAFAGLSDDSFDPRQWIVATDRGKDCRLIRTAANVRASDDSEAFFRLQEFAEWIEAPPLDALAHSWCKPETLFHEIDQKLNAEPAADLEWFRSSAQGCVASPGIDLLRSLLTRRERFLYESQDAVHSLRSAATLSPGLIQLRILGQGEASPLRPFSALTALEELSGSLSGLSEILVADRIAEKLGQSPTVFAIVGPAAFDRQSREVIRLLSESTGQAWLVPEEAANLIQNAQPSRPVDRSRFFLLSSRLTSARKAEEILSSIPPDEARRWLHELVHSASFSDYLTSGTLVEAPSIVHVDRVLEPARSYLSALALLGCEIPIDAVKEFLGLLDCQLDPEQLALPSFTRIEADRFIFADESVRVQFEQRIPAGSRSALCHLAASSLTQSNDSERAALLKVEVGEFESATRLLEKLIQSDAVKSEDAPALFRRFPEDLLLESSVLGNAWASALLSAGCYRTLRRVAVRLGEPARQFYLASAERRMGNYKVALKHLSEIPREREMFRSSLLEGELWRLEREFERSKQRFARCKRLAISDEEMHRLVYEQAMLAFDTESKTPKTSDFQDGASYFDRRLQGYIASARGDFRTAVRRAEQALEMASDYPQKIDASLDLLYTRFLAGEWDAARQDARRALSLVEETEGDRAAAGILFTLAYLCADSGQWDQALQKIEKLEAFYSGCEDPRRLREIDLLRAHLSFSRCDFSAAKRSAEALLSESLPNDIREAAALIVDEVDWIDGSLTICRSSGASTCIELAERFFLLESRLGAPTIARMRGFNRQLRVWELAATGANPPATPPATTRSEKLKLLRSLIAFHHRGASEELTRRAMSLAGEMNLEWEAQKATPGISDELLILQRLASGEFPFETLTDLSWRFARRNRLGSWNEIGSMEPLDKQRLDSLFQNPGPDSVRCDEDSFAQFVGMENWSAATKNAVAALLSSQSELNNLRRAQQQDEELSARIEVPATEGIVGHSPAIRQLLAILHKVSRRDVPVCIEGESGSGKELIAQAIHRHSSRRGKTFTPVNCAALPENLIESELFGHVRGAFTGADRDRAGLIEVTDGGTLFLDEIGELPLTAQAKLLRFLQEGEFRRVGESSNRTADVRILAATNRKLEKAVDEGTFREDLYYRVRGIELTIPPLRDRGSDILLLARHFLAREREKHRSGPDRLAEEVGVVFMSYHWPGNIRELENTIRAAHAIAGESREIKLDHLPERLRNITIVRGSQGTFHDEMNRFRRTLVERSLSEASGNQSQAARLLGISRQALAYQIRELGILLKS